MRNIHRGWFILFILFLTMLGSLGFGRFALGAILPFMREGLGFDYKQIGLIASAAFMGYLVSVAIVGYFAIRYGAKKVINVSLLIVCIGMVVCANATSFWLAYVGCLLLGIGSGGSSIPAMGLAGRWFSNKQKGMAIGIVSGGLGVGILVSGLVVPPIVSISAEGWRLSWYILSAATLLFVFVNALYLKNSPEEVGLKAIGEIADSKSKTGQVEELSDDDKGSVYKDKRVWVIGFIYLSWGFSYLIFSTFLVDYLMTDAGYSKELAGLFFSIAGFVSIVSGFIWGGLSDKYGRMFALSLVLLVQFSMLMVLVASTSVFVVVLAVTIYGLTLWGTPTIMNASVAEFVKLKYVPVAMGFVTIFFSVGQIISPIVTGFIIDTTDHYLGAFLLSAFICLCGAIACMKLHMVQKSKVKSKEEAIAISS